MKILSSAVAGVLLASSLAAQQTELARLVAPPPPVNNPLWNGVVGRAVALSDEWAVVADPGGGRGGEVYLYHRSATGWALSQTLRGEKDALFGQDVALEGDTLVVGASYWGFPTGNALGRVYVYEWTGTQWIGVQQIPAPQDLNLEHWPMFGYAVATFRNILVVSAPGVDQPVSHAGEVLVYERTGGDWVLSARFRLRPVPDVVNGIYGAHGVDVSAWGDTIVAGAGLGMGAAFVYERGPGGWEQTAILENPDPKIGDHFGLSAAIDRGTIVIGRPTSSPFNLRPGKGFIFERGAEGDWNLVQEIRASGGFATDEFGFSAAIHGDRLVVGAQFGKLNGPGSGTVYLFERAANGWPETEGIRMIASDPPPTKEGQLGWAVDICRDFILAGSPSAWDEVGNREGKAYLFTVELGMSYCTPTGPHATLTITGSELAADQRLTLTVRDAPDAVRGLFVLSPSPLGMPFAGQQLCVGAPAIRLAYATTGPQGIVLQEVDFDDPRLAGKLAPGSTWYFQFAHESLATGQRVALSNAVSLTLQ